MMSKKRNLYVDDLEFVIRKLADVWPAERDNVAEAGAKFEELIEALDVSGVQLQKLIDLSWQGLKHLYSEDQYFLSVKMATMQAVNTIREYVLKEGDIAVEDFEKSCTGLQEALDGEKESADTLIENDSQDVRESEKAEQGGQVLAEGDPSEIEESKTDNVESLSGNRPTLDDLAAFIIGLDEEKIGEPELANLIGLMTKLAEDKTPPVSETIRKALEKVEGLEKGEKKEHGGWLQEISEVIELAMDEAENDEWEEEPQDDNTPPSDIQSSDKVNRSSEAAADSPFYIPVEIDTGMVAEFVTECTELLVKAEESLLDLEESPEDEELVNTVFRAFHTIKGTSAFMGLTPISDYTHKVETLLDLIREGNLSFDSSCADITLESIDTIKQMLDVVESAEGGDLLPKPERYDILLDVLTQISEHGKHPGSVYAHDNSLEEDFAPPSPQSGEHKEEALAAVGKEASNGGAESQGQNISKKSASASDLQGSAGKTEADSSVRVNINRLDRLIDMVGELVIAHSVVAQDKAIPKDSDLQKKVNHTTKILRELQDTSLSLRMVPLKATFHKMNRLVRDLSRKAGKKIKFHTSGEDTEIDRNMVDIISEPLVHLIRNAIDHGIELPEERRQNGKSEEAKVSLEASQEGGKVVIKITDDGRGIDKDKILEKAVSRGLAEADKKMTDSEIYNLIFLPGFSSAEQVTDLSGRGVGMDVVRRSIEQLQGKVEVSSSKGKGTTISLELPFTLAITDGMLVRVGDQRFIIPTINIDMTFRAKPQDLYTMLGQSEQVKFRGESVPVIRLHRLFDIPGGMEDLVQGTMLIIRNNNKRYALLVDEVLGQQQLVGKSINMMVKMENISGGAILGDGRVGLILDTATLVN